ncbi:MAG: hypothetical protein HS127_15835 [Planctomycetia bacterium]|nr:hypothetical protein [Planctomycetia bacterium]
MTKTKDELPAALSYVKEIIAGKLGMKLSEDKTKLTNFERGFRFPDTISRASIRV